MPVITPIEPSYAGAADAEAFARGAAPTARGRTARTPSRALRLPRAACALALLLTDLGAFVLAAALAAVLAQPGGWLTDADNPVWLQAMLLSIAVPLAGVLLWFVRRGHYGRRVPFWSELRDMLSATLVALLATGFLQYATQRHDSRLLLGLTWVLFAGVAMLARTLARGALARAGIWQLRVVLVGRADLARQAGQALLSEPRLGYCIAGVVCPEDLTEAEARTAEAPSGRPGHQRAGRRPAGPWRRVLQRHAAELLVLSLDAGDAESRALTESLVRERVPFAAMPRLDGLPVLGFEQTCFFSHDSIMFSYRNNLARPAARALKLVFDLCLASLLLIAAAPALLAIALAVRLDGGPVLYAHRRVGANGREFMCLKFRSMVVDADAVLRRVLESDPAAAAEWSETRKLRRDPRVTWVGKWLRATSLDELPQLLNVLRLEMSLVGPRPIVRSEVARYAEDIAFYYEARPGLTGLWQVSGRSDASYAQRIQLDTWYVKNWTMWHDVAILAKTVPAVLKRQGAV